MVTLLQGPLEEVLKIFNGIRMLYSLGCHFLLSRLSSPRCNCATTSKISSLHEKDFPLICKYRAFLASVLSCNVTCILDRSWYLFMLCSLFFFYGFLHASLFSFINWFWRLFLDHCLGSRGKSCSRKGTTIIKNCGQ